MDFIEKKIKDSKLSIEDQELLDDALSMHITNFQAIALTIENLLKN